MCCAVPGEENNYRITKQPVGCTPMTKKIFLSLYVILRGPGQVKCRRWWVAVYASDQELQTWKTLSIYKGLGK